MSHSRIHSSLFLPKSLRAPEKGREGKLITDHIDAFLNAADEKSDKENVNPAASSSLSLAAMPHTSKDSPSPQTTHSRTMTSQEALERAKLGEELLMLIKSINLKLKIRNHDKDFNLNSKAFIELHSSRFNLRKPLADLKNRFRFHRLETRLIDDAAILCQKIQERLLHADHPDAETISQIGVRLNKLLKETDNFCNQLDKQFIECSYNIENPSALILAQFDAATYDLFIRFYLDAIRAMQEGRFNDFTAQAFQFVDSCQFPVQTPTLTMTDQALQKILIENIKGISAPLGNIAFEFFSTAAALVNTRNWEAFGEYTLSLQARITSLPASAENKDEKEREVEDQPPANNGYRRGG